MKRGSKYLPMIQNVFRAEGLPLDLAYVPLVESAFKPNALSRVKAKGVWQFMTGTALENGLRHDWYIDERSDPEKATVAAAKYLHTLSKIFGGDWHLALASYRRPQLHAACAKTARRSDPDRSRRFCPWETRGICRGFGGDGHRLNRRSGVRLKRDPTVFDKVTLPRPVDLCRGGVQETRPSTKSGPEPRAPPLDHAGPAIQLRAEGACRDGHAVAAGDRRPGGDSSLQYHTGKGDTLPAIRVRSCT
jgi:hypothetical protein